MEELIVVIVVMMVFWVLSHFIRTRLSIRRAFNSRPFTYKYGMAVCTKTKKLIGFETPVYRDHKTGNEYLGKSKRIN